MATRAADQISIVDLTDAYSVILTSEAHTFLGTTKAAKAGSCMTQVIAMCGANIVPASVDISKVTLPDTNGITVTKDTDATSPTLTFTVDTNFDKPGDAIIPIVVDGGKITINKRFSMSIAFTGATGATGAQGAAGKGVKSTTVTYQLGASGTTTPTGTWASTIPEVPAGQYLWTRTVFTYTDNSTSTAYSVGKMGSTGSTGAAGKGVKSTAVTYQASASGTTTPTGNWSNTIPSVPAGQFLWTRTVITYTDNTSSTAYSVGKMGEKGATGAQGPQGAQGVPGADAITMTITSSNGTIFKNTGVETVLTAHVYKGGVEVTATADLAALGTIKWYKDGGSTAIGTGKTLAVSAGSVTNKATYIAQLE